LFHLCSLPEVMLVRRQQGGDKGRRLTSNLILHLRPHDCNLCGCPHWNTSANSLRAFRNCHSMLLTLLELHLGPRDAVCTTIRSSIEPTVRHCDPSHSTNHVRDKTEPYCLKEVQMVHIVCICVLSYINGGWGLDAPSFPPFDTAATLDLDLES